MKLQHQNEDLELEFRKQVLELEKKFQLLHQPLYDQRAKIIQGSVEPTDEECTLPGVEPVSFLFLIMIN
jgi:nucleosome assembly protein 1-like 1